MLRDPLLVRRCINGACGALRAPPMLATDAVSATALGIWPTSLASLRAAARWPHIVACASVYCCFRWNVPTALISPFPFHRCLPTNIDKQDNTVRVCSPTDAVAPSPNGPAFGQHIARCIGKRIADVHTRLGRRTFLWADRGTNRRVER